MKRSHSSERITLADIGERAAIDIITGIIGDNYIGDDCAAIDLGAKYLLITTDMLWEKSHVVPIMRPYDIGYFLIAVNLSDIAAKGGMPIGMVTSLGLPRNYDETDFIELVKGMKDCARNYLTEIIGGDTKECSTLTLSGTAFGLVDKDKILLRKGAKKGDLIAVTGDLGGAAAGYYILKKRKDYLLNDVKKLIRPEPRISEGMALSGTGSVTSCIDISDGLASSIYQLSKVNNVGYEIDLQKIPVSTNAVAESKKDNIPIEELAVYFGGDYELLLTISKQKLKIVEDALRNIGTKITVIGRVTDDMENILILHKKRSILENRGWEHFK